ncbi:MAG TPA: peptidylprolyl isomerase [Myxococcales bacterium]|jgi:peptidyl-prolyl cis-trans isomerase A (cyclophilin A)|nr:peptidylprolyl isomerase [Myxococcales bacterium]
MTNRLLVLAAAAALAATGCKNQTPPANVPPEAPPVAPRPAAPAPPPPAAAAGHALMDMAAAGQPLWAVIKTSMGDVTVELFSKDAPKTVANFVGLASGEKPWTDARSGQPQSRPLYDGTIFHRVIPNFMIQGGDPLGNGTGDPGYRFEDEFQSGRTFDKPGLLAMANSGPNTNGSQFFITVAQPTWLNGHHTIFGHVISGYEVVQRIANAPRDARDRPVETVRINTISVTQQSPPQAH